MVAKASRLHKRRISHPRCTLSITLTITIGYYQLQVKHVTMLVSFNRTKWILFKLKLKKKKFLLLTWSSSTRSHAKKMKNHYYDDVNNCYECGVHFKSFDLEIHFVSISLDDKFRVYMSLIKHHAVQIYILWCFCCKIIQVKAFFADSCENIILFWESTYFLWCLWRL